MEPTERQALTSADITKELSAANPRRLAILGGPGTGKSSLATLVSLEILDGGVPERSFVPVLVPLLTWDPRSHTLHQWIIEQLATEYRMDAPEFGPTAAADLLAAGTVLPVLDGLDEIGDFVRASAIASLREYAADGRASFVIACRDATYHAYVDSTGLPSTLEIEPQEIDSASINRYITDRIPRARSTEWRTFLNKIRDSPDAPVAEALHSPLMLWLFYRIFVECDRDPRLLQSESEFPSKARIEDYLLEEITPCLLQTIRPDAEKPNRPLNHWDGEFARHWLGAISQHNRWLGAYSYMWWHAYDGLPPRVMYFVFLGRFTMLYGLAFGLGFGLELGWLTGSLVFTVALAISAIGAYFQTIRFELRARMLGAAHSWSYYGLRPMPELGPFTGMSIFMIPFSQTLRIWCLWMSFGVPASTVGMFIARDLNYLVFGIASTTAAATVATVVRLTTAPPFLFASFWFGMGPIRSLKENRTMTFITRIISAAIGIALTLVLHHHPISPAVSSASTLTLVLMIFGCICGLLDKTKTSEWMRWQVAKAVMVATGEFPMRVGAFLEDMRRVGILRQSGHYYQFRYARLQDCLASWYKKRSYQEQSSAADD